MTASSPGLTHSLLLRLSPPPDSAAGMLANAEACFLSSTCSPRVGGERVAIDHRIDAHIRYKKRGGLMDLLPRFVCPYRPLLVGKGMDSSLSVRMLDVATHGLTAFFVCFF